MNLSHPFIQRPVATTLLTAGVALAGAFAYSSCPYPRSRKSTIRPSRFRRRSRAPIPRRCRPASRYLWNGTWGRSPMSPRSPPRAPAGQTRITLQFDLDRDTQRRSAGRAGGDQRGRGRRIDQPLEQSELPQGEPRRCAADDHRAHLEDSHPRAALRRRQQRAAAAAVATRRHRAGIDRRRDAAGGACRAQSHGLFRYGVGLEDVARRSHRRTPTVPRVRSRTAITAFSSTPTTRRATRASTVR